jgi:hypothetical protein
MASPFRFIHPLSERIADAATHSCHFLGAAQTVQSYESLTVAGN